MPLLKEMKQDKAVHSSSQGGLISSTKALRYNIAWSFLGEELLRHKCWDTPGSTKKKPEKFLPQNRRRFGDHGGEGHMGNRLYIYYVCKS